MTPPDAVDGMEKRTTGRLQQLFDGFPAVGRWDVANIAILCGAVSGLLETGLRMAALYVRHLPVGDFVGPEFFWAAPLAATASFLLLGAFLILVDAATGDALSARRLAFPLFVLLTTLGLAQGARAGIAGIAPWILSAGVAAATSRAFSRRPLALARFARRSAPWLVAAVLVYALALPASRRLRERSALAALPTPPANAPNVLVVIWDAGRALSSSLYGYQRSTTPELEKLARRGTTFNHAFATAPWSLPSHAAIWTGRYPHELTAGHRSALDGSYPTIGEVLSRRGYATGAFIGNAFYGMPAFGLARGFTTYDAGRRTDLLFVISSWSHSSTLFARYNLSHGLRGNPLIRSAEEINEALVSWLDRRGDRPFLAVVNHFDTHSPYYPPEPYRSAFSKGPGRYWVPEGFQSLSATTLLELKDSYEEAMLYVDHELGELLAALEQRKELAKTVVIVTADHGEAFGEHHPGVVEHGSTLFTTMLRVPLVISYPPSIPSGVRRNETVSIRDIPSTIAELLDVGDHPFPGISLARYANGTVTAQEASSPRLAMVESSARRGEWPKWSADYGDLYSVIGSRLQYIVDAENKEHLYDLDADPFELHDVVSLESSKPVVAQYRALLDSAVMGADGKRHARLGSELGGKRGKRKKKKSAPPVTLKKKSAPPVTL